MKEKDVLASISKYLHDTYESVPVTSSRYLPEVEKNAKLRKRISKYFGVGKVRGYSKQIATRIFRNYDRWLIIYMGKDEQDVRDTVDELSLKMTHEKHILGHFYNMEYPTPLIYDDDDDPSWGIFKFTGQYVPSQSSYSISKSSSEVQLHRPDTNSLTIQFPKVPKAVSIFDTYAVWKKEQSGVDSNGDPVYRYRLIKEFPHEKKHVNLKVNLTDADVNPVPPEVPKDVFLPDEDEISLIPYKQMEIMRVYSETMESTIEDGFWKGVVLFDIETPSPILEDENKPLIGKVIIGFDPQTPNMERIYNQRVAEARSE